MSTRPAIAETTDDPVIQSEDGVLLRLRAPAADLAGSVGCYAVYDARSCAAAGCANEYLPGAAALCFAFGDAPISVGIRNRTAEWSDDAVLLGPTSHVVRVVDNNQRLIAVRIRASGWSRLFAISASQCANRAVPLSQLWDKGFVARLHAALAAAHDADAAAATLDAALRERIAPPGRNDHLVSALATAFGDPACTDCGMIAASLELSLPQLRRLSQRHFGFGPKLMLRRTRFLRTTLAWLDAGALASGPTALEGSPYYDQSHFIRDARQFLGRTARQFAATMTPVMAASLEARRLCPQPPPRAPQLVAVG